jgi:hypothetical protein
LSGQVGRPTDYKEEYCALLIEHMTDGLSYESFAGAIGVSKQTLYDWEKVNAQFLDAKKIGSAKSQLYFENIGNKYLTTQSGDGAINLNTTNWIFQMKNRFGWRDKQPEEVTQVNVSTTNQTFSPAQFVELIKIARGEPL